MSRRNRIADGPLPYKAGLKRKWEKTIYVDHDTGEILESTENYTKKARLYEIASQGTESYYIQTTVLCKKNKNQQLKLW